MGNKVEKLMVSSDVKEGDCCPECNANWDGGDIFEKFRSMRDDENHEHHSYYKGQTDEDLIKSAGHYGWTKDNPRRFGEIIGMELSYDDPEHYDGVSYWLCPGCNIAWNRWDGERTERFKKSIEEQKKGQEIIDEYRKNNKKEEDVSD